MPRPKGSKNRKGKEKVVQIDAEGHDAESRGTSDAETSRAASPAPSSSTVVMDGKPLAPFDSDGNILDRSLAEVDPESATPSRTASPDPCLEEPELPPKPRSQETGRDMLNRVKAVIERSRANEEARTPPAFAAQQAQAAPEPPPVEYNSEGGTPKRRGRPKKQAEEDPSDAKQREEQEKQWKIKQELYIQLIKYRELLGPNDPLPMVQFSVAMPEDQMRTMLAQYRAVRNQQGMEDGLFNMLCNGIKMAEPLICKGLKGDYFGLSDSLRNDPEVRELIAEYVIEYKLSFGLHTRTLMLALRHLQQQKLKNILAKGTAPPPHEHGRNWDDI
jgi:hypothetical protein